MRIKDIMGKGLEYPEALRLVKLIDPTYVVKGGINSSIEDGLYESVELYLKENPITDVTGETIVSDTLSPQHRRTLDAFNSITGESLDILKYKTEAAQSYIDFPELKRRIERIKQAPINVKKIIINDDSSLRDVRFLTCLFGGYKYAIIPMDMSVRSPIIESIQGMFCEVYNSDETNDYFILANENELLYVFLMT
jgi:hypothetical protein